MATLKRMTRTQAEAEGFTVDTNCYPWLAYRGPRFNPTERRDVFTDLEAELLQLQAPEWYEMNPNVTAAGHQRNVAALGKAWLAGQDAGADYMAFTAQVLRDVAKTFFLKGYLHEYTEVEHDGTSGPSISFVFRRQTQPEGYFAEISLVVSPERCGMKVSALRPSSTPGVKFDRQMVSGPALDSEVSLLEQINHVISESPRLVNIAVFRMSRQS